MDSSPPTPVLQALPPVSDSLPVRLMRAREAVMWRFRPILRAHGLTEQQWRVLRTVKDLGETEVTALAGRVFLLGPSLSRILRDLEGRGLILRRLSAEDQRRSLVSLAPAGAALIGELLPPMQAAAAEVRQAYGEARIADLHRLLDQLEAALGLPAPGDEND